MPEIFKRKDLTKKQREWVLRRDDYHSQMRHYSEEKGWYKNENCPYDNYPCDQLEVHHIKPMRMFGPRGNSPENLITLHGCEHQGVCKDERRRPKKTNK